MGPEHDNPSADPAAPSAAPSAAPGAPTVAATAPPPGTTPPLMPRDLPPASASSAWALPEQQAPPSSADAHITNAATAAAMGIRERESAGGSTGGPIGAGGWREPPVDQGPPLLPVPLKPMTMSDILDGSWGVIKSRPRTVLALTAIVILPVQLLAAYLQRDIPSTLDVLNTLNTTTGSLGTSRAANPRMSTVLASYAAQALVALSYYVLGFAIARLVSAWYAGGDLSVKQVLVATGKKAHLIVATFLLLLIPIVVSVAMCYVPAFFVVPLLLLAMPVMAIENANPWGAAVRSCRLVARRLWWVMLFWFTSFLLEALVNYSIQAAPEVLAIVSPDLARFFVPIGAAAARFTTAPFVVAVPVLIYLDLRVRTEGLDLELEVADSFAGAA